MPLPLIIGVVSIVPGLGLWVLGRFKAAFFFALTLGCALLAIYFLPVLRVAVVFFLFGSLWFIQFVFAVRLARVIQAQAKNENLIPQEEQISRKPPSSLTYTDKSIFVVRDIVRQQLKPEERLIKVLLGKVVASPLLGPVGFFATPFCCVGMTQVSLLVVELDPMILKAANVIRIPFEQIHCATVSERKEDIFYLKWEDKQELKLQILGEYRKQLRAILATCGT